MHCRFAPYATLAAVAALGSWTAPALAAQGPRHQTEPYLLPVAPGVTFRTLLEVGAGPLGKGDMPYRMAGIPDGLGAYDNGDGTFSVLMNHELAADKGGPRAHGAASGAFVSAWKIRKSDLKVLDGRDLIRQVHLWDAASKNHVPAEGVVFNRFCSADLAAPGAYYDRKSGKGYGAGRILLNGEEAGLEGRAFAHIASGEAAGTSFELPHLGKYAFENAVASPYEQLKTVVIGLDDQYDKENRRELGEVYVYVGSKQAEGSPVQRAGLVGGTLYGLKVEAPNREESYETGFGEAANLRFTLVDLGDASTLGGAELQAQSSAKGVSVFRRVEDGAWDSRDPKRFYFATTANADSPSRLWRITFDDIGDPARGGSIEMLLDGSEGHRMLDNLTVDTAGRVYLQEDVGGNPRLGRIWRYDPAEAELQMLAEHDARRFLPGPVSFLTQDEESSGIIEVSALFQNVKGYDTRKYRYFLLDVQAHAVHPEPELVEYGQLLLMRSTR